MEVWAFEGRGRGEDVRQGFYIWDFQPPTDNAEGGKALPTLYATSQNFCNRLSGTGVKICLEGGGSERVLHRLSGGFQVVFMLIQLQPLSLLSCFSLQRLVSDARRPLSRGNNGRFTSSTISTQRCPPMKFYDSAKLPVSVPPLLVPVQPRVFAIVCSLVYLSLYSCACLRAIYHFWSAVTILAWLRSFSLTGRPFRNCSCVIAAAHWLYWAAQWAETGFPIHAVCWGKKREGGERNGLQQTGAIRHPGLALLDPPGGRRAVKAFLCCSRQQINATCEVL